jgi:uncharacterized protein (DUF2336 family)
MIVQKFVQWAKTASASGRADGASALARAYLYGDLTSAQRLEAEQAFTGLLDDPSPLVRRALADSFASAEDAPHHVVLALADDQSDISAIVLARSPLLSDAELIDCAAIGDALAQSAIALRPHLSKPVAAALAEVGKREALISLAINPGADLPDFSLQRIIERFGADAEIREALLSRPQLPVTLRSELVAATSRALFAFVTTCNWMPRERAERAAREACEKAHVILAVSSEAESSGPQRLVAHLRASRQLTVGLVLRALLSGNISLFEAALAELSDLPLARVQGLADDCTSAGFAALYRKAGLPPKLLPAFRAALDALQVCGHEDVGTARLSRQMVERVLTACEDMDAADSDKLFAVLRRFEVEAAREDAQAQIVVVQADSVAPRIVIDSVFEPVAIAPRIALEDETVLVLKDADDLGEARIEDGTPVVEHASDFLAPKASFRIDFNALEAELLAA